MHSFTLFSIRILGQKNGFQRAENYIIKVKRVRILLSNNWILVLDSIAEH